MRRAGCLVAAVLFLSAIGAATLLSFALGRAGIVSGLAQLSVLVVVAAIGLLLFSMMFLRVMLRVGRLVADFPEIAELDLNPVMAGPDGCVAVDARVRTASVEPSATLKAW